MGWNPGKALGSGVGNILGGRGASASDIGMGGWGGGMLNNALDPITGANDKKRAGEMEGMIREQEKGLQQQMARQPGYSGVTDSAGVLKNEYKVGKQDSNLTGLENRMGKAKDISVGQVTKGNDVLAGDQYNKGTANLQKLEDRAWGTGPSTWAKTQMSMADAQATQNRDAATKQGANAMQSNMNAMAQQGGLDRGARERMGKSSQRDLLMQQQGISGQTAQSKLGIVAQDEQNRMQLQQSLPGQNLAMDQYKTGLDQQNRQTDIGVQQFNKNMDFGVQGANQALAMNKANAWGNMAGQESAQNQQLAQYNNNNAMGDVANKNNFAQQNWQTGMQVYGNNQMANAQARAGGNSKGGLLGGLM